MDRKIKIRIWDALKKEMYYKTPNNWIYFEDGNILTGIQDCLKIMQYTGLKDKNGKEIYEGDIVKAINILLDTYEVVFDNGCYYAAEKYNEIKLNSGNIVDYKIEIIGNIYENPELAKVIFKY